MKKTCLILSFCCVIGLFGVSGVNGEEVNFGNRVPEISEIEKALLPDLPEEATSLAIRQQNKAASIEIQFEKNSDDLTANAKEMLQQLGKALTKASLQEFHFTIEGHADASGTDEYNMGLSLRRAQSVQSFLVDHSDVKTSRLNIEGKGEKDLLNTSNPYSPENRRVRIVNIGRGD